MVVMTAMAVMALLAVMAVPITMAMMAVMAVMAVTVVMNEKFNHMFVYANVFQCILASLGVYDKARDNTYTRKLMQIRILERQDAPLNHCKSNPTVTSGI